MVKRSIVLLGFSGEAKNTIGKISSRVYAKGINLHRNLFVIECVSAYNIILRKAWIHEMKVISSSYHQMMKFPTLGAYKRSKVTRELLRSVTKSRLSLGDPTKKWHSN